MSVDRPAYKILYVDFARQTFRIGGGQIYLMNLLRGLDRQQFRPYIYSLSDSEIFRDLPETHVIPRKRQFPILDQFDAHGLHHLLSPYVLLQLIHWLICEGLTIRRIVSREHIQLIHINGMLPLIVTCLSGLTFCVPTIYHVHHVIGSRTGRWLMDTFCCFVRKVLCVSAYVEHATLRRNKAKSIVIYNGIPIRETPPKTKTKTLIFAGSMIRMKGYPEFLSAIARIQDTLRKTGYHVECYGDGIDRPSIEQTIEAQGIGDIVQLKGFHANVRDIMRHSRIVVNASIAPEGFGLTIVEGMEAECLVIASCLGGPKEIIIDGKNGYLVDPRNITALAARIEDAVLHYEKRTAIRQAARATICERFDLEKHIQQVEAIYQNLLSPRS